MILQVNYVDSERIQVSDGMNTAYLNINREAETIEMLCRCINKTAGLKELHSSIFVFSDFTFDFDWDYENLKLNVSLESSSFHFLHPGVFHERVFRSKDLSSVLGKTERETLKRQAMKKSLEDKAFEGIEMGELFGIKSSGGLIVEEEAKPAKRSDKIQDELEEPGADQAQKNQQRHANRSEELETAPLDKTLMKNGWLIFPRYSEPEALAKGGLFPSLGSFLDTCTLTSPDCRKGGKPIPADDLLQSKPSNLPIPVFSALEADPELQAPKATQKVRLRKENLSAFRDLNESHSPIKPVQPKIERFKGLSREEEAELDHLVNLTKDNEVQEEEDADLSKKMKRVKPNRQPKIEMRLKPKSPSKVAVRLRIPKTDRSYGLRNREEVRLKSVI